MSARQIQGFLATKARDESIDNVAISSATLVETISPVVQPHLAASILRKRAKPLLGTVVEIAIHAADDAAFVDATNAAFARIAEIHGAMSFHESTSDLAAIANAEPGIRLRVFSDTWKTLSLAIDIECLSDGLFNPTVAPTLVQRGALPRPGAGNMLDALDIIETPAVQCSLGESISLDADNHVRILKRVWIDLGGIAKGYAVDEAVIALQAHGIASGVVNAGGDLRVFGDFEHTIAVRAPSQPNQVLPIAVIANLSCATTAMYYTTADTIVEPDRAKRRAAIHGTTKQKYESISVLAPSCAVADALTKIVWLQNPDSTACRATLNHFKAYAALLDSAGKITRL